MPGPRVRSQVWAIVAAAAALAVALIAVAAVAARSLAARDAAVRTGTLTGIAHAIEAELREVGPDGAQTALDRACTGHGGELLGIALTTPGGATLECGSAAADPVEVPLALGPAWRPAAGTGWGHGGGRRPQGRLVLHPAPALGVTRLLPRLVLGGAVAAALAAARGALERERLAALDAERQRLQALALAGAGLAHRVRNPLAAIKGTAQLLAEQLAEPARARAVRIVEASGRIESLLGRLLTFARPPEPHPERLDLAAVAHAVAERCVGPVAVRAAAPAWVHADRDHVETILEELLANARAFDPDGELDVEVAADERTASLAVLDRGPGPQVAADSAFQPWVTTRPEGTGLGLAIVQALARANGGRVELVPRAGGGAAARLELPAEG
jgi:signal transduction histidine kinase